MPAAVKHLQTWTVCRRRVSFVLYTGFLRNLSGLKAYSRSLREASAGKCCGHSFGRKDADRPVVF